MFISRKLSRAVGKDSAVRGLGGEVAFLNHAASKGNHHTYRFSWLSFCIYQIRRFSVEYGGEWGGQLGINSFEDAPQRIFCLESPCNKLNRLIHSQLSYLSPEVFEIFLLGFGILAYNLHLRIREIIRCSFRRVDCLKGWEKMIMVSWLMESIVAW